MSKISYFIVKKKCTYLRCETSCRTWYNFNQFRFRKEVLYFLIPRSLQEGSPPVRPPGAALDPLGTQAVPRPLAKKCAPNVKSWICASAVPLVINVFSSNLNNYLNSGCSFMLFFFYNFIVLKAFITVLGEEGTFIAILKDDQYFHCSLFIVMHSIILVILC